MPHDTIPLHVERDPSEQPTKGVRLGSVDYQPSASNPQDDFLPADVAAVLMEKNPILRQNAARALRSAVLSGAAMQAGHAYWNDRHGDHKAWQHGMAAIARVALGDD